MLHLSWLLLITPLAAQENCPSDNRCELPTAREERSLFSGINTESLRLYNSLDCQGKRRALFLSKQFKNKNLAVHQAAKEMSIRQKQKVLDPEDFNEEIDEETGQIPLEKRFGY